MISEPLFSSSEIKFALKEIATAINFDYKGLDLAVVVILKGSFIFASDLVRLLESRLTVDFIRVKSYVGIAATDEPLQYYCEKPLDFFKGKHVLLVEDIVDKGKTLEFLFKTFEEHKPKTLKVCSLLYKESAFNLIKTIEYKGFKVANDTFVVGYGMDYDESLRNLPYLASLQP